jgi:RsiW-degrading membrane proteinase PrsW (M82 family)
MPIWLVAAVTGWGAFVATGFGASMNIWVQEYGTAYFQGAGNLLQVLHQVNTATFLSAGVFEELGKGTAIALVYLLLRRYLDGVVSGIVLGAAVGLGFNLTESIEYMTAFHGASAEFQYWVRQSVGIMGAHTAFSAMIGAGFGVARQLDQARLRRIAIGCGLLGACGGHFANDVILRWFAEVGHSWFTPNPTMDVLVVQPLVLAVLQGPFVVMYLLLLRRGLRSQAGGLAAELRAEESTRLGAVTDPEIPILLNPAKRFWLRATTLRRYGLPAYRALGRLQAAQYDLATQRWHRSRHETDDSAVPEEALRQRIRHLRTELGTAVTTAQARPTEATA